MLGLKLYITSSGPDTLVNYLIFIIFEGTINKTNRDSRNKIRKLFGAWPKIISHHGQREKTEGKQRALKSQIQRQIYPLSLCPPPDNH